jgi:parallel beta-helix repeat protein
MLGIIINGWGIENLNYNRSLETDKFQIDGSTNVLKTSSLVSMQYENHSSILIDGNADFNAQASTENWPGNGTASAPYDIDGYNITDPSERYLVEIKNTDVYFQVSNCLLSQGMTGIRLNNVTNAYLFNNSVTENVYGIYLKFSHNNTIWSNTISSNGRIGIWFDNSGGNVLRDNTLLDSILIIQGVLLEDYLQIEVANNSINDKKLVYWQNITGGTVPSGTEQIILVNCNSIEISDQNLSAVHVIFCFNLSIDGNVITESDYDYAIRFYHSKNSTLSHNIVTDNLYGIKLDFSENNSLVNNTITNHNWEGIFIFCSGKNTISYNTIINNRMDGIFLSHSGNNTISYNTITNNTDEGIHLSFSENNSISYNNVNNNGNEGIYLRDSGNSTLSHNTVNNNIDYGIHLRDSGNSTLSHNTVNNSYYEGIYLRDSENSTLTYNIITNNRGDGIQIYQSGYSTISQNTVINSNVYGIHLYTSESCAISQNTVINSNDYGITLESLSSNNSVQFNNFFGNREGSPQAKDSLNSNNTFKYNFWDDWVSPDSNADKIVDFPYLIDGIEQNQDPYPLMAPNMHFVPLTVVYPTGGEILTGNATIRWTFSMDSFGHSITYTVYYSTDNGTNWVLLAKDLLLTRYEWDTTTIVVTGSSFLVKVVVICFEGVTAETSSDTAFTVHNMSPPKLLFPTAEKFLNGTVIIHWENTTDSSGHRITYTLYYSSNNGEVWDIIEDGISATSYVWNTSTVEDNTTYKTKVVATCSEGFTAEDSFDSDLIVHNNISRPFILVPIANDTLSGIITIHWNSSVDALGHEVTYTLYYSSDGGITWLPLALDVVEPYYSWDTFTVPDGNNYRIKVIATCSEGLLTEKFSNGVFIVHNFIIYLGNSVFLVLFVVYAIILTRVSFAFYSKWKKK